MTRDLIVAAYIILDDDALRAGPQTLSWTGGAQSPNAG